MKLYAFIVLLLSFVLTGCRQTALLFKPATQASQAFYNYDSKIISSELDGSYNISAFGRARNAAAAYEEARKQAVYDILFNGVQSSNSRISSLRPLLLEVNAKQKYEDYFNAFFADGGAYQAYTNFSDSRILTENKYSNKLQILVQVTVTVDVKALKKTLIEDNILKTK